jgi:hypothetical protein
MFAQSFFDRIVTVSQDPVEVMTWISARLPPFVLQRRLLWNEAVR